MALLIPLTVPITRLKKMEGLFLVHSLLKSIH